MHDATLLSKERQDWFSPLSVFDRAVPAFVNAAAQHRPGFSTVQLWIRHIQADQPSPKHYVLGASGHRQINKTFQAIHRAPLAIEGVEERGTVTMKAPERASSLLAVDVIDEIEAMILRLIEMRHEEQSAESREDYRHAIDRLDALAYRLKAGG